MMWLGTRQDVGCGDCNPWIRRRDRMPRTRASADSVGSPSPGLPHRPDTRVGMKFVAGVYCADTACVRASNSAIKPGASLLPHRTRLGRKMKMKPAFKS